VSFVVAPPAVEPLMAADYDSPWKEALDVFFEAFLELFFPLAHADIDWSRGWESLDKELQQIAPEAEVGRRYVDKLVKVWLRNGDERWVLIHVEVQMTDEAGFSRRMYVYHCRIFVRYNREVASFAVLGDDNPGWRPRSYGYDLWGTEIGFRFPMVKLLDHAARRAELEGSDNPFATVVLAHLDTQETRQDLSQRKDRKFGLVKRLLERGWDGERVRQLFNLIDWLMELPRDLKIQFSEEVVRYQEERRMPFINTFEELALERGRAEAFTKGIEKLLRVRFRSAASQLMDEIRQIHDYAKLEKILDAAETATTPDELRRLWADGANA
jgi:hypothetical protein